MDAPQWSGGEVYAYDYELTLPDGRTEGVRLRDSTVLNRPGEYQSGKRPVSASRRPWSVSRVRTAYGSAHTHAWAEARQQERENGQCQR